MFPTTIPTMIPSIRHWFQFLPENPLILAQDPYQGSLLKHPLKIFHEIAGLFRQVRVCPEKSIRSKTLGYYQNIKNTYVFTFKIR